VDSERGIPCRRFICPYLTASLLLPLPCLAGAQVHVFSNTSDKAAGLGDGRRVSTGPGQGSLEALGDVDYHLVLEYKIGGPLTYVTASTHCKRFADISVDYVLLNLSRVTEIDIDGIAALEVLERGDVWVAPGG
jgi:MFS superfamily sulfate permease-like transporter